MLQIQVHGLLEQKLQNCDQHSFRQKSSGGGAIVSECEACRAESWGRVLGEGEANPLPLHQLKEL